MSRGWLGAHQAAGESLRSRICGRLLMEPQAARVQLLQLYGNCSSQPPHLTEELPQWLSGPSLVLPTAEFPTGSQTGSNSVLRAAIFYSTIGID